VTSGVVGWADVCYLAVVTLVVYDSCCTRRATTPAHCCCYHREHVVLVPLQVSRSRPALGGALGPWALGDSKRLWHQLVTPVTMNYATGSTDVALQLKHISGSEFEVRAGAGWQADRVVHGGLVFVAGTEATDTPPPPPPSHTVLPLTCRLIFIWRAT
jgi:hypothetical protein